jgi:hypothetical protein
LFSALSLLKQSTLLACKTKQQQAFVLGSISQSGPGRVCRVLLARGVLFGRFSVCFSVVSRLAHFYAQTLPLLMKRNNHFLKQLVGV